MALNYFTSTAEVERFIGTGYPGSNAMREPREPGFCNFTFRDSMEHYRDGWPDGAADMVAALGDVSDLLRYEPGAREPEYTVSDGDWIDIGRYNSGEPECFGRLTGEVPRRTVKILVNIAAHGGVREQEYTMRGAAALAMIDAFKAEGFNVELFAARFNKCARARGGAKHNVQIFKIPAEETSRNQIAAVMAHAGFHRRICWAIMEKQLKVAHPEGYGESVSIYRSPEGLEFFGGEETFRREFIYFETLSTTRGKFSTPERAADYIRETIEEYKTRKEGAAE